MNLSNKTLNDHEYRLLGKGLKFCPKPKHHDEIQLKQDMYEFTRRLRLKEFFSSSSEDSDDEKDCAATAEQNGNPSKYSKGSTSTFIPPAGRDSTLDFYIEAVTHDVLQNNKRYKYRSNLSPVEQEALKSLRQDDTIVIKKSDKSSIVVVMNRDDYIAEANRQLNNSKYYKKLDENPYHKFKQEINDVLEKVHLSEHSEACESLNSPSEGRIPVLFIT